MTSWDERVLREVEQKISFAMKQICQQNNVLVEGLLCIVFELGFSEDHGWLRNFLLVHSGMVVFDVQASQNYEEFTEKNWSYGSRQVGKWRTAEFQWWWMQSNMKKSSSSYPRNIKC